MKNWAQYPSEKNVILSDNSISNSIIRETILHLDEFYSYINNKRSLRTTLLKKALATLGDSLGYKVYANKLPFEMSQKYGGKFKNTEWLFDIHWYTENEDSYMPSSLPLVVESEWSHKKKADRKIPFSGIKYDFQKLLVANADLRLMIFIIKKENDLIVLDSYFEKAIACYKNLATGSQFLFIAFDEKIKGFHFTEKIKH